MMIRGQVLQISATVSHQPVDKVRAPQRTRFRKLLIVCGIVCLAAIAAPVDGAAIYRTHKLQPRDVAYDDKFGHLVGVSGNRIIVGAYQDDDNGTDSGSAFIYDSITGQQLLKLTASDGAAGDWFGHSVAISGNLAIIGAHKDDDMGTDSGSVYVFDVNSGRQLRKLTVPDATGWFGSAVSLDGTIAVIGAERDSVVSQYSGSAYVFDVSTGNSLAKLTPADGGGNRYYFGYSVAVSGNRAVVGALRAQQVVPPSPTPKTRGAAYVFDLNTHEQIFKLTPDEPSFSTNFTWSVAISGNRAIAGAPASDERGSSSGSVHVYDLRTGNKLFKFIASDTKLGDRLGSGTAILGNIGIIGAQGGDNTLVPASYGGVHALNLNTGQELFGFPLPGQNEGTRNWFGASVAASGNVVVVGAPIAHPRLSYPIIRPKAHVFVIIPTPAAAPLSLIALVVGLTRRRRAA